MRKPQLKSGGSARIRFVMLEAELPDGDIEKITQAIQNAVKPAMAVPPRLAPAVVVDNTERSTPSAGVEEPAYEDQDAAEEEENVVAPRKNGEPKVRKFATPKVVDVDLVSGTAWDAYAKEKNPQTDTDKYLTVAAWFKDHRNIDAVTVDHVYTCFRAVNWSIAIADFGAILRQLKHRQFMGQQGRGQYSINHLGLARVQKLGGE
jgi:hypothetical protein